MRQAAASLLVSWSYAAGRPRDAWAVATDPRLDVLLPTELLGDVVARHPDVRRVDTVVRGWAAHGDDRARAVAAVVLALHGHHDEVVALVRGHGLDAPVAIRVQSAMFRAHAVAAAAEVGWYLLTAASTPLRSPLLAYNTACALVRAGGRDDDAVRALDLALQYGWSDLDQLAADDDLRPLHDHPDWRRLVASR